MRIIDPVIVRPWLVEWKTAKARIASSLERANAAKSRAAATRHRKQAGNSLAAFLERLRKFTVLDPACGSGNFLYLALHALHDLEHRVQLEAEAMGLQRAFPSIGPANVKGDRAERLRGRTGPRIGVDRRNPVDAAQRVSGLARARPRSAGDDRVPRCDSDIRGWRDGVARGGRHYRQPAFSGRQAAHHQPRRGIRLDPVRGVRGPGAPRGRPRLLLVREGRRTPGRSGLEAGRPGRDQLHPRRSEPPGAGRGDGRRVDLRRLERRAVGDRWRGRARLAGVLLRGGRRN